MKILLNRSVETVHTQVITSVLLKMICEQSVRICMNAHSPVQQKKKNQETKGDGTGFKEDEKKCSH